MFSQLVHIVQSQVITNHVSFKQKYSIVPLLYYFKTVVTDSAPSTAPHPSPDPFTDLVQVVRQSALPPVTTSSLSASDQQPTPARSRSVAGSFSNACSFLRCSHSYTQRIERI